MRMIRILTGNKKGGVGKTNTTFHLAGALAARGQRVLCCDLDHQANLTAAFLGDAATAALEPKRTFAAVADAARELPFPEALIRPSGIPGVDLLPGSRAAEDFDQSRPWELPGPAVTRMGCLLDEAEGYDLALLDSHPDGGLLTWMGLLAADELLMPLNPENSGARGIGPMLQLLVRARLSEPGNPRLRLLGLLINATREGVALHETFERLLREEYGESVFAATVPLAVPYSESLGRRETIDRHRPRSKAAGRMGAVAEELLARLEGRRPAAAAQEVAHG